MEEYRGAGYAENNREQTILRNDSCKFTAPKTDVLSSWLQYIIISRNPKDQRFTMEGENTAYLPCRNSKPPPAAVH